MNRPIRTLLFSTLYPSGVRPSHGIFVETRLRELLKSGAVDTRVVAPVPWFWSTSERWGDYARIARTPAYEQRNGIDVWHPRYPLLPKVGMSSAPLLLALAALPTLRRLQRQGFDFDLIDAHYYYPDGVAAALLAKWLRKPLAITARGTDLNLIPQHALPRRMIHWAARRADASIGVCAALVDVLRGWGIDGRRLHVMRNGVDLQRFQPQPQAEARRSLAVPDSAHPLLLSVGHLIERKGHHLAIEALAQLRATHPRAQLAIVGEGGERQRLEALAQRLGVREQVRFTGALPQTDLPRWYSAADVLILASSREGWANVLLEAMACGTPVVASRIWGTPEVVASADAGRLVGEPSGSAFAVELSALLSAPPPRARVRAYAEGFGWGATSDAQVDLFQALTQGRAMRDLVLLGLLVAACLWTLRRPWIGAITWTVVSLGSPHVQFGYASGSWPVATAVAVSTLLGMLFSRERANPMAGAAPWALLVLVVWECITMPWWFDLDKSVPLWERSMKIFLMLYITMALLDTRRKLEVFIWAKVLSIGYSGVKGGLFTLATGGSYRIWGPGGFIGGNNELAAALVMTVPLMRYLQMQTTGRWARRGFTAAMGLTLIAAIGTYSRGALLGTAGMLMFFAWRSDRKLLWAVLLVIGMLVFLTFMPDTWWDRMGTMRTYQADESAQGRLVAWNDACEIAKDRIMAGGGFQVALASVYARYAPETITPLVAHSIYFQMLGEHGFLGLFLFLLVGVLTWLNARRMVRMGHGDPALKWAGDLGAMIQVSMIGFGITGAFLSLAYFDMPYNLMALSALGLRFALRESAQPAPAATLIPPPAGSPSRPGGGLRTSGAGRPA